MLAFALPVPPPLLTVWLHRHRERSSTAVLGPRAAPTQPANSVTGLSPDHFQRRVTRLVSYYALFKGWLLLSQPPSCLGNPTSLST